MFLAFSSSLEKSSPFETIAAPNLDDPIDCIPMIFEAAFQERLVVLFGYLNVLFVLLLLSSCRCVGIFKVFRGLLTENKVFRRFYDFHCYFWYGLLISVVLHAVLAVDLYGGL